MKRNRNHNVWKCAWHGRAHCCRKKFAQRTGEIRTIFILEARDRRCDGPPIEKRGHVHLFYRFGSLHRARACWAEGSVPGDGRIARSACGRGKNLETSIARDFESESEDIHARCFDRTQKMLCSIRTPERSEGSDWYALNFFTCFREQDVVFPLPCDAEITLGEALPPKARFFENTNAS